jgi:hypothetical protein
MIKMPPIGLSQIQSLPDALTTERFVLNFGNVPGGDNSFFNLTIRCQDALIAGVRNATFPIMLQGQTRNFRGRREYQHIMQATFMEGVDLGCLTTLRNWEENVVGTQSGSSNGYIADYAVAVSLQVYDTAGNVADNMTLFRCYPVDIQDIQLTGQGTTAMQVLATFSYDYVLWNGVTYM